MQRQLVVGAVIVDSLSHSRTVLAARRTRPDNLRGRFEFPGGKVDPGETPEVALAREVHEELGLVIAVGPELAHPDGAWTIDDQLELRLFFATVVDGQLTLGDTHDEVLEVPVSDLLALPWVPADLPAAERLSVERDG